jgi:hypothetical protein
LIKRVATTANLAPETIESISVSQRHTGAINAVCPTDHDERTMAMNRNGNLANHLSKPSASSEIP